jgi:glucose-6-phosphate isomerase
VAVSTNKAAVATFGIPDDGQHMFAMWDFVGGRYSIWGSVGLSVSLTYGFQVFSELLAGAALLDAHFYDEAKRKNWRQNLPVILALLGHWYNTVCKWETLAILPYEAGLVHLPSYLQQLDMESNGKRALRAECLQNHVASPDTTASYSLYSSSRMRSGGKNFGSSSNHRTLASWPTGQIVWGSVGTNGQHAFYQLLHQGTKNVQIEFLGARHPTKHHAIAKDVLDFTRHHQALLANMIAQSEALLRGTPLPGELENSSATASSLSLSMSRYFEGNRPSSVLLYDCLNAVHLGALIALYEHKVAVQGHLWGIYSFDQWGVELGKQLANRILDAHKIDLLSAPTLEKLDEKGNACTKSHLSYSSGSTHDPSTAALLSHLGLSS